MVKWALAAFFLRILEAKVHKRIIKGVVIVYTIYMGAFLLAIVFDCGKPDAQAYILQKHCINWPHILAPLNYISVILNTVVDWIFTLLPVSVILKLKMTKRAKISVCSLMVLALLGSVVSIIRTPFVKNIDPRDNNKFFKSMAPIAITSLLESTIGILTISLAACRPLFGKWLENARTRLATRANNGTGSALSQPSWNARDNKDTTALNGLGQDIDLKQITVVHEYGCVEEEGRVKY
jgi:hypothetical protein